ncbi:Methyltransferase type 11 [Catenulispora acidiphila DSM 44928]|uniref:Methyltransferase type 11 n=1 Tax=Catenulispora acidiphila (strain DSM 44928 / JCM 14897 / NBRC 102108 / NRRL B-24433 / ID139908) TaxID=479433 RepID=C7Q7Q2_CATAD|nr:class I SAM-dependent methyltransferase [Catenulispora acidiphila]ACU72245.1 Methyltransferase type 11 [Catenulispora acidiphila DSM 44928]
MDLTGGNVARFDAWAPVYEASALQDVYYARVHDRVLAMASAAGASPAPRRVLDVGCGTGRLLRTAADAFPEARLVGVDISAGMLAQAVAMTGAAERDAYVRADSAALPFADGAFDVVTCTANSHHWPEPTAALGELHRITASRGLLVLAHLEGVASWDPPGRRHIRRRGVRISARLAVPLLDCGFRITDAALFADCPLMPATVVLGARRR